jgi:hypothetical protein
MKHSWWEAQNGMSSADIAGGETVRLTDAQYWLGESDMGNGRRPYVNVDM